MDRHTSTKQLNKKLGPRLAQSFKLVFFSKGQTKTKRERQDLNTAKKGGVPAAQEESSTVCRPSNKLHKKSLTPGLTTQLPVLSSATGVLGYW